MNMVSSVNFSRKDKLDTIVNLSPKQYSKLSKSIAELVKNNKLKPSQKRIFDKILEAEGVSDISEDVVQHRMEVLSQVANFLYDEPSIAKAAFNEAAFWVSFLPKKGKGANGPIDLGSLPSKVDLSSKVKHIFQGKNNSKCFVTCKDIVNNAVSGLSIGGAATTHSLISKKHSTNGEDWDILGFESVPGAFSPAIAYLMSMLANGVPVIAGVAHHTANHVSKNKDGVTDHFVVITGYKRNGKKVSFQYDDVGTTREGPWWFETKKVKKGVMTQWLLYSDKTYRKDGLPYVVTQIRPYENKEYAFNTITGQQKKTVYTA